YFIISLLLYANVLYYREFADFMTLSTMMGNLGLEGGSNVSFGLITSFFVMLRIWDAAYWLDFILLIWIIRKQIKATEISTIQPKKPFYKRYAVAASRSEERRVGKECRYLSVLDPRKDTALVVTDNI